MLFEVVLDRFEEIVFGRCDGVVGRVWIFFRYL